MKEYIVGGFVRDKFLNRLSHDTDYVVVGATIQDMLDLGYKQVGKEFPVFLDEEGCEHALARKEVSTGDKYTDFEFDFSPNTTLIEDLQRRDFTINSMCLEQDANGNYVKLVDPLNGKQDLDNRIIRHISNHFKEDPLRVLRAARFSAQLNFIIHEFTIELCKEMVSAGMLNSLTPERVWKEMEKALASPNFYLFLQSLAKCNALEVILPEVQQLNFVPEKLEYHPEGTTYNHLMLVLKYASENDFANRALLNFALLCHDLGKLKTQECWPSHHSHEIYGVDVINSLCNRLKVPNEYRDIANMVCTHHMRFYKYLESSIKSHYNMIDSVTRCKSDNSWKLNLLLSAHDCDLHGRLGEIASQRLETFDKVIDLISKEFSILKDKTLKDLPEKTQQDLSRFKGTQFGKLYRDAKISYLKYHLN